MPQLNFAAATLPPHSRLNIAIKSLVKLEPVSHIAKRENVSRNFVYDQKYKAESALNQAFLPTEQDKDVLFYLPVTRAWITQLVLCLIFICHSSFRGVIEFMKTLFDTSISVGSIHNLLVDTAHQTKLINVSQDLSLIQTALLDELFQGNRPVLAGVELNPPIAFCYPKQSIGTQILGGYTC